MVSLSRILKYGSGVFGVFFFLYLALPVSAGQKIRFSDKWKFNRGNASGAQEAGFNDGSWETVYLPHTVKEELNYRTHEIYMGVCWYRKSFTLPSSYEGKIMYIEFGAAMQSAEVWVNDTSLITHTGGYTPFVIDITDHVQFGGTNVIAARLDNRSNESFPPGNSNPDFLYFGGLYRDVNMYVMDGLHITHPILANIPAGGGIFVTYSSISSSSATVQVKTHVLNEHPDSQSCVVTTTILDASGESVAANTTPGTEIGSGTSNTFTQNLNVSNPKLWTPNAPNLYTVRSEVFGNGGSTPVDTISMTIGIRSIGFSKANGFQINGTRHRLHGCNRHMAYPYIGNAVPKSGQYRDALRIKEFGYDFVRMSHYMQPESFVDACDRLGIASMACLPGWQYYSDSQTFRDNSVKALRDIIRVYRNHPSVIVYEAVHNESNPTATYLSAAQAAAHEEYPGDQIFTCGEEENNILDVYISSAQHGVRNYNGSRPCIISEYGDWEHGCIWNGADPITGCQMRIERSAGESALNTVRSTRANDISLNEECPWFTVDGVWTIFDYQSWDMAPYTASGDIDIFRIPKYSRYASQSSPDPAVELASPSSEIKVDIDTANLTFIADGSDIAIVYASNVNNDVTFSVSGPGTLVGNNPAEAIAGIAAILLRAGTTEGQITVSASSGASSGNTTVTSHANDPATIISFPPIQQIRSLTAIERFVIRRMGRGFLVEASGSATKQFTLFNLQGRVAGCWNLTKNSTMVDIGSIAKGVYIGRIDSESNHLIRKLVW